METPAENTNLAVWYDGDCPVCRQEVALYRRIDRWQRIDWIDITALDEYELPEGKSRGELLGRFHARDRDDDWRIGVDAFAAIWDRLPGLRWGAFLFRIPGTRHIAELAYRGFLRWQRWHRSRRLLQG